MKHTKTHKHKDIAAKAGLHPSYVYRVFKGERIPRVHKFKSIANAIGVSLDTLYNHLKHFYEGKEKK